VRRLSALAGLEGRSADDLTVRQVKTQLAGMACSAYEVGVLPPKHRKDLTPERTRTFTADQVVKSIPWLRRMNALDYDIYIRPAPLADGTVQPLVFIDDITRDAVARMRDAGFRFSALVESSPGNFHGWIRVADQPIGANEATATAKKLAQQFGGDPNSADWRHYGRLAGFTNRKPERRTARGHPFAIIREAVTVVTDAARAVLASVRAYLAEKRAAEERGRAQRIADIGRFRGGAAGLKEATAAFTEAWQRAAGSDDSARDLSACMSLLKRRYDAAQVEAAFRAASPGLDDRHRRVDDYIARTVAKAAEFIGREPPPAPRPDTGPGFRM